MPRKRPWSLGLLAVVLAFLCMIMGKELVPQRTIPPRPATPMETQPGSAAEDARWEEILRGCVRDGDRPVAGARVRFQGQLESVISDDGGRFQLPRRHRPAERVTAWKDGFLIAGSRADTFPFALTLTRLPARDNEDYAWVNPRPDATDSQRCARCHDEIYQEWASSGHARSVNNPFFRNLYEGSDAQGRPGVGWSLLDENPGGAGVCASCHAPTLPLNQDYFDIRAARGVAAQGVHCDYCHKIIGLDQGTLGLSHGRFNLRLLRPEHDQLFFGPLDDVDRGEDGFSPFYRDSRYCASCHEGVVFGVHVYSTYSEWQSSPARRQGKQCQDCHMKPTGKLTNIAPGQGGIERNPSTLANHRFFAGSQIDMLKHSLRISTTWTARADGVEARVAIQVRDVGHRVPTGFVDRHLLLVVEGQDAEGRATPLRAGPRLPAVAGKDWAGRPGRLYGKLLTDAAGHSPVPFWRDIERVDDTRLYPEQTDQTVFSFPLGVQRIRVRLLYRRFWREVAEVKGWKNDEVTVHEATTVVGNP